MATPAVEPATMNRRFIAYLLDGLLLTAVALFVVGTIVPGFGTASDAFARVAIIGAVGLAYFGLSWTQLGGSPFQRLLGVRTLNAADGALLTPSQALWRWAYLYGPGVLTSAVSVLPGASAVSFLSLIWAYYLYRTVSRDPQRRGFHDHKTGTIVVRSPS
ncbi:MAG TPA: RDD family protein [Candidatus Limnocylindria bacterium]